jgi:ppGpp synthetase/RelA/SpoT-type nucleotidyltranferase
VTLDREAARTTFDERRRLYARANVRIADVLNALLDDLSRVHGVREGLMVIGEPKTFDSFYRKAVDKYGCESVEEAFDRVRDLSRVRVICHTLDDCYSLVELLDAQQSLHVVPASVEDKIKSPSPTGYRAIHLEVVVDVPFDGEEVGVPVEVQFRTTLQEAWGHFTHVDFYHASPANHPIDTLMRELSDLLLWADKHAALLVRELAASRAAPASATGAPDEA